jgi:hypothetical protein
VLLHEIPGLAILVLQARVHERRLDDVLEHLHIHDPIFASFGLGTISAHREQDTTLPVLAIDLPLFLLSIVN